MRFACALWFLVAFLLTMPIGADPALSREQEAAREVIALTNQVRASQGLMPLLPLAGLDVAAQGHSQEMLDLAYFSHTSPTAGRGDVGERIKLAGGSWRACAENIYMSSGMPLETAAQAAVNGWVESPGHFSNMVDPVYTHIGVGIAYKNGTMYATQVFTKP